MKVGLIGIGRMGMPIGFRLIAAGHEVTAYDIRPDATAKLGQAGARVAVDAAHVASDSDVIVTSLPGSAPVNDLFSTPAFTAAIPAGTLCIETSTVSPELSRRLAADCGARGVGFVDAPVSGGVQGAQDGTLTAMVGGTVKAFSAAKPVLANFCTSILHLGPAGSGSVAKLISQAIYLSYVSAFCENVSIGRHLGLDIPVLLQVLRTSLAGTPLRMRWDSRLEGKSTQAQQFPVDDALRDLALARDEYAATLSEAPILASVFAAFEKAAASGNGKADMTVLFDVFNPGVRTF